MKSNFGKILMTAGAVCLVVALSLLVYNYEDEKRAEQAANDVAEAVISQIKLVNQEEQADTPAGVIGDILPLPFEEEEEPVGIGTLGTMLVDGREYVGTISIPVLELELPVISEWSYPNLKVAPCMYHMDVENNSIVIAAHNYKSHFGSIQLLNKGNEIIFTDVDANEYRYTIVEIVTKEATDIVGMLDDSWDLTLFTCNYSGAARVTVRCMMKT